MQCSFNGKFRDELLNREWFLSLAEARWVIDRWRLDYNHRSPLSSLDYQTIAAFAASWLASVWPMALLQQACCPMHPDSLLRSRVSSGKFDEFTFLSELPRGG